ncbi:hypothetical protein [Blautia marasmi]|uniref:hypothetical protein n=1 Tax=Blautia marasmi TaxID=1917868 RepID=UPI003AB91D5B
MTRGKERLNIAHVQSKGWLTYVKDGEAAVTTGESRRLRGRPGEFRNMVSKYPQPLINRQRNTL